MNIAITFRQMDATDAVKGYTNEKVGKLQKFLKQPLHGTVTLSCQKMVNHVEVDLHAGGEHYHAHEENADMYAAIDLVVDKAERQIRGNHTLHKHKGGERTSDALLPDEPEE